MTRRYRFVELPPHERELYEMVLLEEMDMQAWYAIRLSSLMDEEIFVILQ